MKGRRILTVEIMGSVAVWLFMILTRAVPAAVVGVRYRWSAEHPGREPERMIAQIGPGPGARSRDGRGSTRVLFFPRQGGRG